MADERARAAKEERLQEVGRRYLLSETPVLIARALRCSTAQVNRDLVILRSRWADAARRSHEEFVGESLARLSSLYQCCMEGYAASKLPRETTLSEKTTMGDMEGTRASLHKESQSGNPAYLVAATRIEQARMKLLGMGKPSRCEVSAEPEETMTKEELDKELQRLMSVYKVPSIYLDRDLYAHSIMPPGFPPQPPREAPLPRDEFEQFAWIMQIRAHEDARRTEEGGAAHARSN